MIAEMVQELHMGRVAESSAAVRHGRAAIGHPGRFDGVKITVCGR